MVRTTNGDRVRFGKPKKRAAAGPEYTTLGRNVPACGGILQAAHCPGAATARTRLGLSLEDWRSDFPGHHPFPDQSY
jgi:hypothetical protein